MFGLIEAKSPDGKRMPSRSCLMLPRNHGNPRDQSALVTTFRRGNGSDLT